jgi:hypothetical protein
MKPGLTLPLLSAVLAMILLLPSCSNNLLSEARFGYRHKVKVGKQPETNIFKQPIASGPKKEETAGSIHDAPTTEMYLDEQITSFSAPAIEKEQTGVLANINECKPEITLHNTQMLPTIPPEKDNSVEALASAGFVFTLIGLFTLATFLGWLFGLVGLIFCIIALARIRKNGTKGKGLAVAGIIIFITTIILTAVILAIIMNTGG